MSVFSARNVLPVVTSLVATLFLATATSHDFVPEMEVALASSSLLRAEAQGCMADGRDEIGRASCRERVSPYV